MTEDQVDDLLAPERLSKHDLINRYDDQNDVIELMSSMFTERENELKLVYAENQAVKAQLAAKEKQLEEMENKLAANKPDRSKGYFDVPTVHKN